jgi:hypothetical protein
MASVGNRIAERGWDWKCHCLETPLNKVFLVEEAPESGKIGVFRVLSN